MARWLFKEEPTHYSYDMLEKDGATTWNGVRNPLAQKNLRNVRKDDLIFYYHSGKEKAIVGVARAKANAVPDSSGKLWVVDVMPVQKLKRPVTLSELKANRAFAGFALVRLPRLSVMPVEDAQWQEIERLAKS